MTYAHSRHAPRATRHAPRATRHALLVRQARVTDMHSTLMGYYDEPDGQTSYVSLTLNPQGWETKREPRVWNSGSGRGRLIIAASPTFHDILSNL